MELKCEFKSEAYLDTEYYTCLVDEASITKPVIKIKEFIGKHQPGRSNEDVEAIKFQGKTIHYFPRGLSKMFPALKVLWIDECGLKLITRDDLFGLEKLEVLNLGCNQLQWLPSNLLVGMTNLKRVVFFNNELERVSSKLLEPIARNNLELVDFTGNSKINSYFRPENGALKGTKNLQELMIIIDEKCKKTG
jgi:hypothetical protein